MEHGIPHLGCQSGDCPEPSSFFRRPAAGTEGRTVTSRRLADRCTHVLESARVCVYVDGGGGEGEGKGEGPCKEEQPEAWKEQHTQRQLKSTEPLEMIHMRMEMHAVRTRDDTGSIDVSLHFICRCCEALRTRWFREWPF